MGSEELSPESTNRLPLRTSPTAPQVTAAPRAVVLSGIWVGEVTGWENSSRELS